MDAAGVIAYYVMDGNRPLTSESAGNTAFFLYGRGVIGEKQILGIDYLTLWYWDAD